MGSGTKEVLSLRPEGCGDFTAYRGARPFFVFHSSPQPWGGETESQIAHVSFFRMAPSSLHTEVDLCIIEAGYALRSCPSGAVIARFIRDAAFVRRRWRVEVRAGIQAEAVVAIALVLRLPMYFDYRPIWQSHTIAAGIVAYPINR